MTPRSARAPQRAKYPRYQHMQPQTLQCRCGKVYSPTEKDARNNRIAYGNAAGALNPVRFYQCDHGGWHWTSNTSRWTD